MLDAGHEAHGTLCGTPRSKRLHCLFADFRSALLRDSLSRVSKMSIEVYWHLRVSGNRARIAFAELALPSRAGQQSNWIGFEPVLPP
jgi:hypothetical protein